MTLGAAPTLPALPSSLDAELRGAVAVLTLDRPAKRNALSDEMIGGIEAFFLGLPASVAAVVIAAAGDHFSAGLDLSEMSERSTFDGMVHSRMWHRVFELVESGPVPVVAALKGAVVGGGLELAAAAHIRVAERSTFYALPEGQRGIFVGGGAAVRVPRLMGTARMIDLILTGRRLDAEEGAAAGLSQYVVDDGTGREEALALAERIAQNAPQTNYAVVQALPRIAEANPREGYLMEAMMAAITQGTDDAKARMQAFLDGRAAKVTDR
ncbi:crotonase/enoyl-CoA hydratase family protein [Nocardioides acrostichi]|uniref:Crotonase/enoyl-CoA hydratase family protein n=1 Tax=Nocardioides acrostichi TaxID=2784339 RepID=A0A930YBS6_9ACTN|nr:crotonase/enoyl-CoA hydratase family protein [Nocardioides acrostichi]MBF4160764.1 crotonase/enoyl-CoA hydratase family protein [Nocardioides acrostichi]